MPRSKRTFASINQLPSKRWQVRYTGPDGVRRYAPHTFETRVNAEAFVVATRRKIDRDQWNASDDAPRENITFGAYAAYAPASTISPSSTTTYWTPSVTARSRDQAQRCSRLVCGDTDRQAHDAQPRLLAATHNLRQRAQR